MKVSTESIALFFYVMRLRAECRASQYAGALPNMCVYNYELHQMQ